MTRARRRGGKHDDDDDDNDSHEDDEADDVPLNLRAEGNEEPQLSGENKQPASQPVTGVFSSWRC